MGLVPPRIRFCFYAVLTALAGIAPAFVGMGGGGVFGFGRGCWACVLCSWRCCVGAPMMPIVSHRCGCSAFLFFICFLLFLGLGLDATWDVLSGGGVMNKPPEQTPESRWRAICAAATCLSAGAVFGLAALFFVITIVKKGLAV